MYQTNMYEGMLAETITMPGLDNDLINAYFAPARLGAEPFPGVVVVHHMPGWDEWYRKARVSLPTMAMPPFVPTCISGPGMAHPEDVAAKVRGEGGIPDDQAVGDIAGAMGYLRSLPYVSDKIGVFGTCSGGRHAYLAACRAPGFNAVVDCWGGNVVVAEADLTPKRPVAPIDYTKDLPCPILGLFGEDDHSPTPEQVWPA